MKKLTRTGAVVLIIAATLLVYWPALRNGFVWDDTALVLRDPLIRSWRLIAEGFRHFLFLDATASNFYRPIQRLTFVLDYQLYGFAAPWGWHLTSILIHIGAAIALFFTAEQLIALLSPRADESPTPTERSATSGEHTRPECGSRRPAETNFPATSESTNDDTPNLSSHTNRLLALCVALIWAIHPLQTSAVTYVAGRADPLAALFGFTGLALGLHALLQRKSSTSAPSKPHRAWPWHLAAALCFLLAMLSKESGLIFLPLWLLILAWQRTTWRLFIPWIPLIALIVAAYSDLRFSAEKVPPPPSPPTPAAIRPILAARAFAGYAGLFVAPITLRMERDITTHPLDTPEATFRQARLLEYQTLAGVLLIIGLLAWMRFGFRRESIVALSLIAFLIAYLPISNLFSLNATIAEHWLYVPSAWLLLAAAVTFDEMWQRLPRTLPRAFPRSIPRTLSPTIPRRISYSLTALLTAWLLFLGIRTFLRQSDWHDQRTFIERTIAAGGRSARMLMNLGNVEFAAGHPDLALARYREALKGAPDQPIIWLGYASVLLRAQDFPAAREALGHAEASPLLAADCLSLRATLENAESSTDPGNLLHQAVDLAPDNWNLQKRYIEYLQRSQQLPKALSTLQQFMKRHPFRAESWRLLATMLEQQHQSDYALQAWREAAQRDVRDEESRKALQRLTHDAQ